MSFWQQSNHPVEIKTPENMAEGLELLEMALDEITTGLLKAEEMNKEDAPSPVVKTDLLRFPHARTTTTFTELPQNWSAICNDEHQGELDYKWKGRHRYFFAKSGKLSLMMGDCRPQTLYQRTEGEIEGKGETYRTAWRPYFHEQVQRDISTAVEYLAPICETSGWSADAFDRLIAWDRDHEQKRAEIRDAHVLIAKLRRKHGITGGLFFVKGQSKAKHADGNGEKPTHRRRREPNRQPTEKQLEALKVVGECAQNFAEAGRRLKRDPKTVRQHYNAGLRKAGNLASRLIGKPSTQSVPQDHRGQTTVATDDDGPAAIGQRPIVQRNRR